MILLDILLEPGVLRPKPHATEMRCSDLVTVLKRTVSPRCLRLSPSLEVYVSLSAKTFLTSMNPQVY